MYYLTCMLSFESLGWQIMNKTVLVQYVQNVKVLLRLLPRGWKFCLLPLVTSSTDREALTNLARQPMKRLRFYVIKPKVFKQNPKSHLSDFWSCSNMDLNVLCLLLTNVTIVDHSKHNLNQWMLKLIQINYLL